MIYLYIYHTSTVVLLQMECWECEMELNYTWNQEYEEDGKNRNRENQGQTSAKEEDTVFVSWEMTVFTLWRFMHYKNKWTPAIIKWEVVWYHAQGHLGSVPAPLLFPDKRGGAGPSSRGGGRHMQVNECSRMGCEHHQCPAVNVLLNNTLERQPIRAHSCSSVNLRTSLSPDWEQSFRDGNARNITGLSPSPPAGSLSGGKTENTLTPHTLRTNTGRAVSGHGTGITGTLL